MHQQVYTALGLMSGTSLDGLDLALCRFQKNDSWSFEILDAETFTYENSLREELRHAHNLSGLELTLLHVRLGELFGKISRAFCDKQAIHPDFIASHGHTIFHRPDEKMTLQIASPAHIAEASRLPVVADFRSGDLARGGQGAPLVPIGDELLFDHYTYCLNLGGISNVSVKNSAGKIQSAFDLGICNMALNWLAEKAGMNYDANGNLARTGAVNASLLKTLNAHTYYQQSAPKSLGKEFFLQNTEPLLVKSDLPINDLLATFCEHIAIQISHHCTAGNILATGGGALNTYLMQRISDHCKGDVIVPDHTIVQFKEALIFAFLGVLRMREEINCLACVTGADEDHCSGAVYLP